MVHESCKLALPGICSKKVVEQGEGTLVGYFWIYLLEKGKPCGISTKHLSQCTCLPAFIADIHFPQYIAEPVFIAAIGRHFVEYLLELYCRYRRWTIAVDYNGWGSSSCGLWSILFFSRIIFPLGATALCRQFYTRNKCRVAGSMTLYGLFPGLCCFTQGCIFVYLLFCSSKRCWLLHCNRLFYTWCLWKGNTCHS